MRARLRATPLLVVALWGIWSSAFLAIKIGLGYADPEAFATLRVSAALVALVPTVVVLRARRGRPLGDPRVHRFGLMLAGTNVVGFLLLQNFGMVEAGVGISSVLIYTQPLLVALGARLVIGERLSPLRIIGLVAGWFGVVALVAGELEFGVAPLSSVLFLLGSASFWAAGTLLFKWLPTDVSVWHLLLAMNAYGLVPVAAVAIWQSADVTWTPTLVVTGLWAGMAASIGGFGLQFVLLRRGEAGVVSSWIFAVPILASALGVLVLDEQPHLGLLVGGAAVALGIYLVNRTSQTPAEPVVGS